MTRYALWQQLVSYPAQTDRLFPEAVWPVPGRLTGMAVTVGTGRVVNIAAGKAVVALGGGMGSALCVSDAVETATFAAAPGAGSTRIDLLIVQVHDAAIDAGSTNGFTFDVVQGTPAASPTPPATPARALVLAQITSVGGQANLAQGNIAQSSRGYAATLAAPFTIPNANVGYKIFESPVLPAGRWRYWSTMAFGANGAGAYPGGYQYLLLGTANAGQTFGTYSVGWGDGNASASPLSQLNVSSVVHGVADLWLPSTLQFWAMSPSPQGSVIGAIVTAMGLGGSGWAVYPVD